MNRTVFTNRFYNINNNLEADSHNKHFGSENILTKRQLMVSETSDVSISNNNLKTTENSVTTENQYTEKEVYLFNLLILFF